MATASPFQSLLRSPPAPGPEGDSLGATPPTPLETSRLALSFSAQIEVGRGEGIKQLSPEQKAALKDIFANLSSAQLIPELNNQPGARAELMNSLLQEVMNPYEVNQGRKCTCAATEVMRQLAESNPVAYAQIVSDLVTKRTATLPNGERLNFVADSLVRDEGPYDDPAGKRVLMSIGGSVSARSISERVIQSAAMNYAMGGGYSNATDQDGTGGKGLLDNQFKNLANACGLGQGSELGFYTGRGSTLEERRADIVERIRARTEAGQQTSVSMFWRGGSEEEHSCHCVTVLGVEMRNGVEYVRIHNPISVTSDPNGTIFRDPPREIIDHTRGIELMRRDEFEGRVRFALDESADPHASVAAADNRVTGAALTYRGSDNVEYASPSEPVVGEIRHSVTIDNGIVRDVVRPKDNDEDLQQGRPKQRKRIIEDEIPEVPKKKR